LGAEDFAQRLKRLAVGLHALIDEYQPQEVAIERVFMAKNALLDMLEDLDDVQDVYSNAELGAEAYA